MTVTKRTAREANHNSSKMDAQTAPERIHICICMIQKKSEADTPAESKKSFNVQAGNEE